MTNSEAVNWLNNLIDDIGAPQHSSLWDYEQALSEIKELIGAGSQWISCSERLPEYPFGCLVTVWDTDPITMDEFENILPYFVGWDGEQWNDVEGEQCPFEVIAWMPLPEPYKDRCAEE